ncbi:hypothetical protein HDU67_003754 [Dinochytrium kinnereticum]|nr:hypothetical protein HDU67_003754 [Dinochytrium kinnereticum]
MVHKRTSQHREGDPLLPSSTASLSTSGRYDPKMKKGKGGGWCWTIMVAVVVAAAMASWFVFYAGKAEEEQDPTATGYYLIENANIHTVDPTNPHATTLVVQNGRFIQVGDANLKHNHPNAKRINLHNKTVIPGLIDSHAHLMMLGHSLLQVNLAGTKSLQEIRSHLLLFLSKNPLEKGQWLIGRGWDQTRWGGDGSFPGFWDLDVEKRLREVPIVMTRIDGHALWVNGKGLELARKEFPAEWGMEGGEIVVDERGEPTGVFVDDAMNIVFKAIPPKTESQDLAALKAATQHMLENGLTGLHDAGVTLEQIDLYKK